MKSIEKIGYLRITNIVARTRNVYTSYAILTLWYHFTWRRSFYGNVTSRAAITLSYPRKVPDIFVRL